MLWTRRQQETLAGLLLAVGVVLAVRWWLNPAQIPDPLPPEPVMTGLADRIDPNTADWPALAALPGVGEKLAQQIVAYRDGFQKDHPGQPAFATLKDLQEVRGIGPATAAQLEQFLSLPVDRPADGP